MVILTIHVLVTRNASMVIVSSGYDERNPLNNVDDDDDNQFFQIVSLIGQRQKTLLPFCVQYRVTMLCCIKGTSRFRGSTAFFFLPPYKHHRRTIHVRPQKKNVPPSMFLRHRDPTHLAPLSSLFGRNESENWFRGFYVILCYLF